MDTIKCPVCGELNLANAEFCQNCMSRLEPLTGPLKEENAPLQPGQVPTKKVTAELEPILPQWLREAREKARQSAGDDSPDSSLSAKNPPTPPPSAPDLLAGLTSQSDDDDEDVPDWLVSLTGNAPARKKKNEPEDTQVKWVELGGQEDIAEDASQSIGATQAPSEVPTQNTTPRWMLSQEPAPEKDELTDWLSKADQPSAPAPAPEQSSAFAPPFDSNPSIPASSTSSDDSDWLKKLDAGPFGSTQASPESHSPDRSGDLYPQSTPASPPSPSSDVPDWLNNLQAQQPPSQPSSLPAQESQMPPQPDWLGQTGAPTQSGPAAPSEVPDWLNNLQAQQPPSPPPSQSPSLPAQESQTPPQPDWLGQAGAPTQNEPAAPSEVPDWLKAFGQAPESEGSSTSFDSSSNLPDWLQAAAPKNDSSPSQAPQVTQDVPQKSQPAMPSRPSQDAGPAPASPESPDWLSSLRSSDLQPPPPPAEAPEPPTSAPAFTDASAVAGDSDAIFGSMQMPDWLSALEPENANQPPETAGQPSDEINPPSPAPAPAPTGDSVSPVPTGDSIAPAELPSWVQAMRPVESARPSSIPSSFTSSGDSVMIEGAGPLAGLENVLPGGDAYRPTSRPKAYSIKLNATTEHQNQAALLDQILAAETAPIPMKSVSVIMSQQVLRWIVTVLVFLGVGAVFLLGTQSLFAVPASISGDQTETALSAIWNMPAGAPALVVFDYEPSLSGEMSTIAGPYLRRLILVKQAHLTILSSSPTGSALAEEFMSGLDTGPLPIKSYNRGQWYMDLGYLPGGLAGIHDFALNPKGTMPLDADGLKAWQSAPWKDVKSFSNFAAIILITDSVEAGRAWVEQAGTPLRGNASLVVLSSSQAGPMLMPYVASGQINGLVNGLNDAAKIEQANGQPDLARRYWDAYNVGLLLAALLIILGGGWSFILGLQARRAAKEEG